MKKVDVITLALVRCDINVKSAETWARSIVEAEFGSKSEGRSAPNVRVTASRVAPPAPKVSVAPTNVPAVPVRRHTLRDVCHRAVMSGKGKLLSVAAVHAIVLRTREDASHGTVQTTLSQLSKLGLIENVWGQGYRHIDR